MGMSSSEAFQMFESKVSGPVSAGDFDRALQSAVGHLRKPDENSRFLGFVEIVPSALDLMLDWYKKGLEYRLVLNDPMDLAYFVAHHTRGCVWCVLLRHAHARRP